MPEYKEGYLKKVPAKVFHGNWALTVATRAMLHWIKKGNEERAAQRAREAAHYGNIVIKHGWRME